MGDNEMTEMREAYRSATRLGGLIENPGTWSAFTAGVAYGALTRNGQDIAAALAAAIDQARPKSSDQAAADLCAAGAGGLK